MNNNEYVEFFSKINNEIIQVNRYIMRRAWGEYYAVWAMSIFLFSFTPLAFSHISNPLLFLLYPIFDSVVWITAIVLSSRIFSRSGRFYEFMESNRLVMTRKNRKYLVIIPLLIISFVYLISFLVNPRIGYTLFLSILVLIDFSVYRGLTRSFSRIPLEGYVAIISFLISIFLSFLISLKMNDLRFSLYFSMAWIPAVISWIFSSIYSFYKAPEELIGHER